MSGPLIDRVRAVIQQVAESHTAFAAMVGISKDKLSKSLAGSRRFTSLELALIAEAGGVTVDWLLTGKTPARPSIAARTTQGAVLDMPSVNELIDRYLAAYDVLDLLGQESRAPQLPHVPDAKLPAEQGEAIAGHALRLLTGAEQVVATLDTAGLAAVAETVFGVDVAIGRLPSGLDGLAWQRDGRRLIFLSRTKQWTRQRFTFAHELGHILAGDAQQALVDEHLSPGMEKHPSEIRANSFAAALLMPAAELRRRAVNGLAHNAFARLVVDFKVSPSAMAARLRSLGLLGAAEFDGMKAMTSLECHELAGRLDRYVAMVNGSLSTRLPAQLVSSLFLAYRDGRTTLRPLANLLGVPVDDLREALSDPPPTATSDGHDELVYTL